MFTGRTEVAQVVRCQDLGSWASARGPALFDAAINANPLTSLHPLARTGFRLSR